MIVIKAPAGFEPTWPALPVNPVWREGGPGTTRRCVIELHDLAALLGPKDCERCGGTRKVVRPSRLASPSGEIVVNVADCAACVEGKVPQRVALAIETPCETCAGRGWLGPEESLVRCGHCPDPTRPEWAGSSGVRLRVEYTAQVDAVVPIVEEVGDAPGDVVCCGEGILDFWPADATEYTDGVPLAWPPADWSPGRVAVLISDVQPTSVDVGVLAVRRLRPFDGPVAELSEVLA